MDKSKVFQNKWLIAFIAVAVALVAAIVVIIVMGVSSTPDVPGDTTLSDGAETGVYYYDVEGGEVILSLNSGNKFTIAGTNYNKSGTYTVDGESLTLDFVRDEDGTATAAVNGNTVTVTLSDSTVWTFLKKVNYTVSFNTNGGSATESVTVVNGKPAAKPADPAKDGSVFLGWYADEAFTSTYDFSSAVTGDVTVYAYWAEKAVGQPEYNAKFELGYEGAEEITATTIGGKLYKLPTPEREGYTFMGWFVSDYEDGAKLTYQYTDGIVLDANTTLYAVWKDNADTKLPSPMVSVSGNTIKWNSVDGASSYSIKVLDSEGNVLHSETLGSTQKTYNFSDRAAGDYTVEVTAVAPNSANNSAPAVRCYKNKALNRVSQFQVVNGILVFSPVENAERYFVTVSCGNPQHEHTMLNNNSSTVFDFSGCTMQPGGIKFNVTASAAGFASSVSETFVYDKTLPAIGTIVYNSATDSFVWDAVANATGYKVEVVVGGNTTVFTVPTTYFSLANFSGDITVKVSPVSEGYNTPAAVTGAFTKTAPAAPTNLKINGMVISWDDNGSTAYAVRIGNKQFDTNTNSIDLSGKSLALAEGDECVIKVVAIKNGEYSAESTITAKYLDMSDAIKYENNTVSWPAIIGSSKFEVRVNGGKAITVIGTNSAKVVLDRAGENVIEVRCSDAPGATWYSVKVFAYTVTYNSRSLSGIATEYVAKGDALNMPQDFTNAGYTFSGWYVTPNAAQGNGKEYTDAVLNNVGDMVLYANWTPNQYNFNFNVSDNVEIEATQWPVTYMKDFILPVPTSTGEQEGHYFLGWFTAPAGTGEKITDEFGQSVAPYKVIGDSTLYPYFAAALTFVREEDGTYGVRQGPALSGNKAVTNVVIPAEYNGIPVTKIRDNAFYYCENIETIKIPDTVVKIGVGAFEVCRSLKSVEVYETEHEEELYEAVYSSYDGALIYRDETSQKTYLEFFPRAKVGTYTIPDGVTNVRAYAFKYSTVEKVIIGKDVTTVADASFYKCTKLVEIAFAFERAENVTIGKLAFDGLTKLTTLVLPAKCNEIEEMKTLLDNLPSLTTINVEEGGEFYSSLNGMLCNGLGTELIYVPVTFKGDNGVFEAPLGIQSIGAGVFEGKTALTEIIIPEYLRTIGLNAFKDCTGITKVTVKGPRSNALTIGEASFTGCTALVEVDFQGAAQASGKGAITVGTAAFKDCVNLDTIRIGESVNVFELGNSAFAGNVSLQDIVIANSATLAKIGNNTFEGCTRLKSFTIHASTYSIGNGAFTGCSFLNTVEFAEGGGDISFGSYVFKDCERLTTIKLPKTLTTFDGSAFDGCERITNIIVDPANPVLTTVNSVLYTKDMTELLYFPRNLELNLDALPWNTLTKLGASAFKNNPQVKNVKIGAKIVELGDGAFEGCINLESVEFLNTTDDMIIGDRVFKDCAKLTEVILPAKTSKIGNSAFYMTGLAEIDIPDAVTEIGSYAFSYTNIESIELPAALTKIGTGAFNMASKLTTVTFAEGTNDLYIGDLEGYTAENPMPELPANRLPGDFYGYGYSIFYGTKVKEIVFPSNLKSIDDYAFYGTKSLTSVTIPENVRLTNLGKYAFAYTAFPTIELGNNLTVVNEFAFAFSQLKSAHIPATVTHIYKFAFATKTFTSITFDNGDADDTLELAHKALTGANLTGTLVLPSHLAQLGEYNVTLVGDDVLGVFYEFRASTYNTSSSPVKPYIEQTDILPADKTYLADNASLAKIEVAAGNTRYGSKDGVLYGLSEVDKSFATLLFSPRGNTGDENGVVTVPKTVVYVQHGAFNKMTGIKKIIFEEFAKDDPKYGQPLLTIGSYIGTAYESTTDPCKVIFSSGNNSPLEEISFPSHLAIMYSRSIVGVRNYVGTKLLTVNFNPDALVEFEQAAMRGNSYITTLNLPKLKRVALQAFYQSSGVTSIYIAPGSTATELGNRSFESCSKLTTFTVPESIEMIGEACFRSCSKLAEFLPENPDKGFKITTLGTECFKQCAFTEFVIPEGVIAMGTNAFASCSKLTSITIPTTLENVVPSSSSLIEGCSTITAIHVAEGHPYLISEDGVLYDKDKTTLYIYPAAKGAGYELPSTIVNIEGGALRNYKGTSITLPDGLLHINNNAFAGASLTSIVIPASVQTIKGSAFSGTKLQSLVFADIQNSSLELIGTYAFSSTAISTLNLPDRVTLIGTYAFSGCTNLTSVVLPAALTELGNYTFNNCSKLASVTMQEGLASIGNNCFTGSAMTTVTLPDSVATMGQMVFSNNKSLTSVTFTEDSKLASIGLRLFDGCTALKEVTFGPLVEELPMASYVNYEMSIFYGCTSLERVVLPANLKKIPGYLFIIKHDKPLAHNNFVETIEGNTSIREVVMPSALEEIGPNAFHGCTNIESIDLPETITTIGINAFKGCTALTAVNFADGCAIKSIGEGAFENTIKLSNIVIPESVTEFGARAFKNSAVASTPIGPNVTKIGDEAFYGCTNLTEVTIPTGVKNIGARAFYGCSNIESLGLTSGLKNIGDFAFAYCTNLTSVILPDTVTGITANPFMGCTALESMEVLSPDFYYDAENGVLFDRDITMILFYAPFNTQDDYEIPAMVEVMGGAFANSQLKNLVLSETTKKIPADAFRDSIYLENVVIPASVRSIAENAFNGCKKLDNVIIPASVESIGDYAFAGCSSMENFTVSERKTEISVGSHLFDGCASLSEFVDFPGLTEFTPYMYAGTGIVNLVIPDSITHLSTEGVFMNCTKLETIDFGTNISGSLGDRLFKGCTSLKSVATPESIYAIGNWEIGETFMDCTDLTTVSTYATSINKSAFENCTKLTTVNFTTPDQWTTVGVESRGFKNCSALTTINLECVYMFGQESFAGCVGLSGDIKMNNDANVYDNAFNGCVNIGKITIGRPYLNDYAFTGLTSNTVIYIKNYKSLEEYTGDWNDATWMQNTEATVEYFAPSTGQTVTLTPDEIAQVEMFCQKFNVKDMDAVKAKMLDFKSSFITLFPANTLTKEEQAGIFTFCEEFGLKDAEGVMNQFLNYRARLASTLLDTAFDQYEQDLLQTCKDKFALPADSEPLFLQSLYEYKLAYADRNPGDELPKEDQAALQMWMKEIGFKDADGSLYERFVNNFIAYKKHLASKMPVEITHVVTDAEQKAIDTLYKEGKIGKEHIEIFQNAIIEFKANFVSLGLTAGEPSKEEMAMLYTFLEENGLKPNLADEWIKNGSYVAFKAKVAARTSLSNTEREFLDGWLKKGLISDDARVKLEERILAYKASFNMTEAPAKPDSAALAALTTFLKEQGVDKSVQTECVKGYAGYMATLVKEIM